MPHDYAKPRNSRKGNSKPSARKSSRSATRVREPSDSHWSWFLTGLMAGLFMAFILYLGFIRQPESRPAVNPELAEQAPDDRENAVEFDFYEYLTEAEVKVDVVPVAERPLPQQDTRQFMLQAGSFSTRQDAETRRASVMLLNLDAAVVAAVVNGQTRYRVQLGPFSRDAVDDARDVLAENNIETATLVMR